MRRGWVEGLLGFVALACNVTEPCATETRYVAQYDRWRVVCLVPQDGAQVCIVWPAGAPDWLGDVKQMPLHGVRLTAITVCRDVPITDTPQR